MILYLIAIFNFCMVIIMPNRLIDNMVAGTLCTIVWIYFNFKISAGKTEDG